MKYFEYSETLKSLFGSAFYGIAFFLFLFILRYLLNILSLLPTVIKSVFKYNSKIFSKSVSKKDMDGYSPGRIFVFFSIVLFSFGNFLLNYYFLDGAVRLYTSIVSALVIFLLYRLHSKISVKLLSLITATIINVFVIVLRCLLVPMRYIFLFKIFLWKKLLKKSKNVKIA